MKKKHILVSVSALLSLCVFSGCNEAVETWKPIGSNNTITIAVVGDDTFYMDGGTVEAMELASKDFQTASGVDLNVSFFDDDADYHKANSYANEIASDPEIAAVIIKQGI